MTSVALAAEIRNERGKSGMNKLRARGLCPAVVYGPGTEPLSVSIDPKGFLKLLHVSGENALIDLTVGGDAAAKKVIVREIQYDPLKPLPSHVDFYVVSLDRAIEVRVPLEFVGTPVAVAQKTGMLTQAMHELNVECLPTAIPASIKVDVSGLSLGGAVHVRDLAVPAGVTVLDAADQTVAAVAGLGAEEAAVAPSTETAEPEVIRERKAAEE
ncbi:MAG TPA: 50S ribosomal protein L25 [bacterium]